LKCDVPRLLFSGKEGNALNVSVIDLGNRFRMVVNTLKTVAPPQSMPHLPVAHALWEPMPNLQVAAATWIHAGGAHHSAYSQQVSVDMLADYADILGMEMVVIDESTETRKFKQELKTNSLYYRLASGV